DHVDGTRLSDLLRVVAARGVRLDLTIAICLIRQLVPAVAQLHGQARDVAHGLLAPERLVLTPNARLMIVEHGLGSAIEQLRLPRERLWQDLRVALPSAAGLARFDQRADITAVGLIALALLLGRPLGADEFPHGLAALLAEARERTAGADEQPLSAPLRDWLARSLQLDPRRPFGSAIDALAGFEEVVAGNSAYAATPVALQRFLSRSGLALVAPLPGRPLVDAPALPVRAIVVSPRAPTMPPTPVAAEPSPSPPPAPAAADAPRLNPVSVAAETQPPDDPVEASSAALPADPAPVRATTEIIDTDVLLAPEKASGAALFDDECAAPTGVDAPASAGEPGRVTAPDASEAPGHTPAASGPRFRLAAIAAAVVTIAAGGYVAPRFLSRATVAPITVTAGAPARQHVERAAPPQSGQLRVQSQPAGARVQVDGVARGTAPVTVLQLAPGAREVVLHSPTGSVTQAVTIQAGDTASIVVPVGVAPGATPAAGWVTVRSPISVEVREQGKLLGTSDGGRLTLTAGRHELEIANAALEYRLTRSVQVAPGRTAEVVVELPTGSVNLNATPWAEVFIDGHRVGETPIGNVNVAIGPHEVLFRNPQLGEKRQSISVTLAAPVRLSVDMK
ncbi:MAG: PEGA domain-containing protein, partial [Vicinamibacterales bacterium]